MNFFLEQLVLGSSKLFVYLPTHYAKCHHNKEVSDAFVQLALGEVKLCDLNAKVHLPPLLSVLAPIMFNLIDASTNTPSNHVSSQWLH
jgi:hypothetical protein